MATATDNTKTSCLRVVDIDGTANTHPPKLIPSLLEDTVR
jgi:hypothetical protein